ncbi:hypothetical protein XI38_08795 [Microbacterium aurantiacum]|uniref:Uncharacterized protein n=1 Tax=Microbacterium aurantiacum TaxID=162393 RepID=A0A0M8MG87_9MICO|nr:hypothetical protein XI38_08795 [Microbacterium chocolatum]
MQTTVDTFAVSSSERVFRIMAFSTVIPLMAYLLGFVLPILVWPFGIDVTGIGGWTLAIGLWGTALLLAATLVWVIRDKGITKTSQLWTLVVFAAVVPFLTLAISFRSLTQAAIVGAAIIPIVAIALGVVLSRREKNDKLDSLERMVRSTGRGVMAGGRTPAIVAVVAGVYSVAVYVAVSIRIIAFPEQWSSVISSDSGVFTLRSGQVGMLPVVIVALVLGVALTWGSAALAVSRYRLRRRFLDSGRTLDDFSLDQVKAGFADVAQHEARRGRFLRGTPVTPPPIPQAPVPQAGASQAPAPQDVAPAPVPQETTSAPAKRAGRGALITGLAFLGWAALNFSIAWNLGSNGVDAELRMFYLAQFFISTLVGVPVLLRCVRKGWWMVILGFVIAFVLTGVGAVAEGLNAFTVDDLVSD